MAGELCLVGAAALKTWMAGTGPAMTVGGRMPCPCLSDVKEPAPSGPEPEGAAPEGIEGGARDARLDGYGKVEEPDGASHAGFLGASTWTSTRLPRASCPPAA